MRFLFASVLACVAGQVNAVNWVQLNEPNVKKDSTTYLDTESVHNDGQYRVATELIDFKTSEGGSRSIRYAAVYDCSARKVRIAQWAQFSGNMATGIVISNLVTPADPWQYIHPGTSAAAASVHACTPAFPSFQASGWRAVPLDTEGSIPVYVTNLKEGDVRKVWEVWSYPAGHPKEAKVRSVRAFNEYDCGGSRRRIVSGFAMSELNGHGQLVFTLWESPWEDIPPTATGDKPRNPARILALACGSK